MTQPSDRSESLYEQRAATVAGALGLAAAGLAMRVGRLIHAAKDESGLSSKEIAERLGVTEGRMSQILNGDGNVRIATFARVMRVLGYSVELVAMPTEPGRNILHSIMRRRRRDGSSPSKNYEVFEQTFLTGEGPMTVPMFVPADDQLGCAPHGVPIYAGRVNVSTSHSTPVRRVAPPVDPWRAPGVTPHAATRS